MNSSSESIRLAIWSGPRNISTAMMRAFENRTDCEVVDEPFYAFYLARSGADHPVRDLVLASQSTDWSEVIEGLLEPLSSPVRVLYQKHMVHHLLDGVDRSWMDGMRHAFLIRDPRRMLASYAKKRDTVSLGDLGLREELELFRWLAKRLGSLPPVLDAHDVRADPRGKLEALCTALGIPFDGAMLAWPPGPRTSDGVWGPHWYDAVLSSTGFRPESEEPVELSPELERIAEEAQPYYEELRRHRL